MFIYIFWLASYLITIKQNYYYLQIRGFNSRNFFIPGCRVLPEWYIAKLNNLINELSNKHKLNHSGDYLISVKRFVKKSAAHNPQKQKVL